MISIDRKIAGTSLKLAKSYDDMIFFDFNTSRLSLEQSEASRNLKYSPEDIRYSIDRLCDRGWLKIQRKAWGAYYFTITPELKHRFAFWFDTFTKKFWGGFVFGIVSGVLVTLISQLLLIYIRIWLGI